MSVLKKISWGEVNNEIKLVNPILHKLIQSEFEKKVLPDYFQKLYIATYKLGEEIAENGRLIPFTEFDEYESTLNDDLYSNIIPVGLLLNSRSEIYSYIGDRIIHNAILKTGNLFGIFELLDHRSGIRAEKELPEIQFSMSAGYRNILFSFALSNLQDAFRSFLEQKLVPNEMSKLISTKKILFENAFKKGPVPFLNTMHHLTNDLVSSHNEKNFLTKIIFFPNRLINSLCDQSNKLLFYFNQIGWKQSAALRNSELKNYSILNKIKMKISSPQFKNSNKVHSFFTSDQKKINIYNSTMMKIIFDISDGLVPGYCFRELEEDFDDPIWQTQQVLHFLSSNSDEFRTKQLRVFYLDYLNALNNTGFQTISYQHTPIEEHNENDNAYNEFLICKEALSQYPEFSSKIKSIDFYHSNPNVLNNYKNDLAEKLKIYFQTKGKATLFSNFAFIKYSKNIAFPVLPVLEKIKSNSVIGIPSEKEIFLIGVQHLMETTGSLIESIIDLGVKPKNIFLLGKIYSSHPHTIKKLKEIGVSVQSTTISKQLGNNKETFTNDVNKMWQNLMERIKPRDKIIILDDGGYTIKEAPIARLKKNDIKVVAIEQTTSGINHIREFQMLPVINVAGSIVKTKVEPYIVSESILLKCAEIFQDSTNKKIGVIGLGNIGQNLVDLLIKNNFKINIFDKNRKSLLKYSNNKNIFLTNSTTDLFLHSDVIIGCTGEDVSEKKWTNICNGKKVLFSFSSGDVEFNKVLSALNTKASFTSPIDDIIYKVNHANSITLKRGGFVANFDGSRESAPDHLIQLTRGLLLSAFIQANELDDYKPKIHDLDNYSQAVCLNIWQKYSKEFIERNNLSLSNLL